MAACSKSETRGALQKHIEESLKGCWPSCCVVLLHMKLRSSGVKTQTL